MKDGSGLCAEKLRQWTGGRWTALPDTACTMRGFHFDSRKLQPGMIFLALPGRRDGHDFVADAARSGAIAAMVTRENTDIELPQLVVDDVLLAFQQIAATLRKSFSGLVIAVTGSCGKTSTKNALGTLLGDEDTLMTEGNLNNHIGVPLTLSRLAAGKYRYAVIEAGVSAVGEMEALSRLIHPDLTVITKIAPAHLEGLGSIDVVAKEKMRMAELAAPNSPIVLPVSCMYEWVRQAFGARLNVLVEAGYRAQHAVPHYWSWEEGGTGAGTLTTPAGEVLQFELPALSRGQRSNLLLAAIAALLSGIPYGQVRNNLSLWTPAPLRGEIRHSQHSVFYLDCYNANPASMEDAIEAFEAGFANAPRRLYILGPMYELGGSAAQWHYSVGRQLQLQPEDTVVALGPFAADYERGIRSRNPQADCLTDLEEGALKHLIAHYEGAIFLKGSRSSALEQLLPLGLQPSVANHKPC